MGVVEKRGCGAGGVALLVGAVAGAVLIQALCCLCLGRRRRCTSPAAGFCMVCMCCRGLMYPWCSSACMRRLADSWDAGITCREQRTLHRRSDLVAVSSLLLPRCMLSRHTYHRR